MDGIEPERDFRQFHGHRVTVNTIDIVRGNVSLDLLQFLPVLVVPQSFTGLKLLRLQISLGKLGDGLIEEGTAAHGRLADGEPENIVRRFVLEQLLEGVFDYALG